MSKTEELGIKNFKIAIATTVFVFIILMLLFLNTTYRNAKRDMFVSIRELERQNIAMLKQNLDINKNFVLSISINLGRLTDDLNSAETIRYLREQSWLTNFSALYIINREGNMYFGGKSSKIEKDYYLSLSSKSGFYTNLKVLDLKTGSFLTINSPVMHDGNVIGILSARFYKNKLNELITFDIFDGKGYCYLLSKDGSIVARSNNSAVDKEAETIQELFLSGAGEDEGKKYYSEILDKMEKGIPGEMICRKKDKN